MTTLGSTGATLLLGCGYLGSVMVRRLCLGDQPSPVIAVTRSDARHQVLGALGARCLRADLAHAAAIDALRPPLEEHRGDVFALLPPSAWPPDAAASAVAALAARLCASRRAILVSSTAVYGDTGGADVSADSQTDARSDRSARLLAIEQAWMNAGFDSYVVGVVTGILICATTIQPTTRTTSLIISTLFRPPFFFL